MAEIDRVSMLQGWLMGRRIAGQRKVTGEAEKTLTGYSYNGMKLPVLPEWPDYPYLLIKGMTVFGEMTYYVQGYQTKPVTIEFDPIFGDNYDVLTMPQEGLWKSSVQEDETKWYKPDAEPNEGTHSTTLSHIVWANFDIYTSTGELHLAASEPVPVYE